MGGLLPTGLTAPLCAPIRIRFGFEFSFVLIPLQQVVVSTEIKEQIEFAVDDLVCHGIYLFAAPIFSHCIGAPSPVSRFKLRRCLFELFEVIGIGEVICYALVCMTEFGLSFHRPGTFEVAHGVEFL